MLPYDAKSRGKKKVLFLIGVQKLEVNDSKALNTLLSTLKWKLTGDSTTTTKADAWGENGKGGAERIWWNKRIYFTFWFLFF